MLKAIADEKLIILGQGELNDDLRSLANELGLCDNVIFLGFKANPFKYMKRADMLVLSSLREAFGNVLVEAMACEIPVISTDCRSGPREIIAPNTDVKQSTQEIEYGKYGV